MRFSRALALLENLTDREAEVFELLGLGLSNRGIATDLRITERTVKAHVARTLDKLGLNGPLRGSGGRLYVALQHRTVARVSTRWDVG